MNLLAGVLVGGKSSRYGRPKALELLANGETVIEHVVKTAALLADELVLLGTKFELPPSLDAYRQLPDYSNGAGPITGLHSLLTHANDRWALMLACDLPLLHEDLFHPLIQTACNRTDCDVIAYGTGLPERPAYTCCALYHPRVLPRVERAIERGEFRLQAVSGGGDVHLIEPSPQQQRMLQDMNTPEDKTRLLGE